jgi:hypothetical protein
MRVLPILVIAVLVLFFAGLIVPGRSKRLQIWVDERLQQGREKGRRNAGWVGDWTAKSMKAGQRLNARVVSAGRAVREKLPV